MALRHAVAVSVVGVLSSVGAVAVGHEPPVGVAGPPDPVVLPAEHRPVIQVAVLLDTSNSMDGLIDQARTQLWRIVNELGKCRRDGRAPRLQVALYEYGNNNLAPGEGYVRQVLPLTDDLDLLSGKLFGLRTNGGEEYCGAVISSAAQGLSWSPDPHVYKAIFIAGNEPFTQGTTDYRTAVASAVGRGIVVNTVHCGDLQTGVAGMWQDGAARGEGKFMVINQDERCVSVPAPQDDRIMKLSIELNNTYVGYGPRAEAARQSQTRADADAAANVAAGAAVQRAVSKASRMYTNAEWDLVDAANDGKVDLDGVDRSQLPAPLAALPADELRAHVETQAKRRAELQAEINQLNAERERFVAQQAKQQGEQTLDAAVVRTVRDQAAARGFDVGR